MTGDRQARLRARLTEALDPKELLVRDQSHLHAGHAGSADGRGHFSVRIVSTHFAGLPPIRRHRLVYQAVGNMMDTDIHALSITALSPDEIGNSEN